VEDLVKRTFLMKKKKETKSLGKIKRTNNNDGSIEIIATNGEDCELNNGIYNDDEEGKGREQ